MEMARVGGTLRSLPLLLTYLRFIRMGSAESETKVWEMWGESLEQFRKQLFDSLIEQLLCAMRCVVAKDAAANSPDVVSALPKMAAGCGKV